MLTISLGLRTGSFGTSTYFDELRPYEFGVERRFSIFEEQGQDFTKVRIQFIQRFSLRVCSRKARDESNEEPSFRRPFDNGCIGLHVGKISMRETRAGASIRAIGARRWCLSISKLRARSLPAEALPCGPQ